MNTRLATSISKLDAWLQTMRQPGGYGGPVVHWWQHRMQFAGAGHDWRYEGILIGYATLFEKNQQGRWLQRLRYASQDLCEVQTSEGSYLASRFELNPGTLGTPHEASASLGLLRASPHLSDRALVVAQRNLDNLIDKLWDGDGFNDAVGVKGRVPNKLASLAHALIALASHTQDERYLSYSEAALGDLLRFQVRRGRQAGAIHQYAPGDAGGDGRFFPYYNARCIPPLMAAFETTGKVLYREAAEAILLWLERCQNDDGSWNQIVYRGGRQARYPRWIAGAADIMLAFLVMNAPLPDLALKRLFDSQLPSGAFPTAEGFCAQVHQRHPGPIPHFRDVMPVVGWNDKVLRFLSELLPAEHNLPTVSVLSWQREVQLRPKRMASFQESAERFCLMQDDDCLYLWNKTEPWARVGHQEVNVR